jgi:hypothetical protein
MDKVDELCDPLKGFLNVNGYGLCMFSVAPLGILFKLNWCTILLMLIKV